MEIKESFLKNGGEVDEFFGKIGVNRGRYTLRWNAEKERYEIVRVYFSTIHKPERSKVLSSLTSLDLSVKTYNLMAGTNDVAVEDNTVIEDPDFDNGDLADA